MQLVEKDMKDLEITYEELTKSTRIDLKKELKHLATNASFVGLKQRLMKHNKVKHIKYKSLQLQPYLISENIHQYEAQIITGCRSKCVKTVRSIFSKMYKNRLFCPLKCSEEDPNIDTQEHIWRCPNIKIKNTNNVRIQDVFEEQEGQENVGKLVVKILKERSRQIDELETSLPGGNPGPNLH